MINLTFTEKLKNVKADDSHEIEDLFSPKIEKIQISYAVVVIGIVRVEV